MPLQEPMHFFGQLGANSFRSRNFLSRGFAQAFHITKPSQQQIFPVLTDARTIVKNAFADALFHEQLMISIGETMGFVANTLEQAQSTGIDRQLQRQRPARPVNFFMFFRQANNRQIMQSEPLQLTARRRQLTLSAVDNDEIGEANVARASGLR